jgi:hypothetical protein
VKRDLKDWCITKELALDRRVEASNSCVGTLIFGSFFFIVFCQSFFLVHFRFFLLTFYCLFSFCRIGFFIVLRLTLLFRHCFIPVSLAHVVSSLAYPNLLGTKRFGCCCCLLLLFSYLNLAVGPNLRRGPAGLPAYAWPTRPRRPARATQPLYQVFPDPLPTRYRVHPQIGFSPF